MGAGVRVGAGVSDGPSVPRCGVGVQVGGNCGNSEVAVGAMADVGLPHAANTTAAMSQKFNRDVLIIFVIFVSFVDRI
jgi:hypothetical protein